VALGPAVLVLAVELVVAPVEEPAEAALNRDVQDNI